MGNVLINEESMKAIADAIREKSGNENFYKPGEMAGAILEISTYSGDGPDPNKPVCFYGPYGDLEYSFSLSELESMTELPVLPEYKGLIGQNWTWTLDGIKELADEIEVGSLYITDDGATRIYIDLTEETLNPKVGFRQSVPNSVRVDWGDGSASSTSDVYGYDVVSLEHRYEKAGEYVISLIPEGETEITLTGYTAGTMLLHAKPENYSGNYKFSSAIRKVELGEKISELSSYGLTSETIISVNIPNYITSFSSAFSGCISLKSLTIPPNIGTLGVNSFASCYGLEKVFFPEGRVSGNGSLFKGCNNLETVIISNNLDDKSATFSQCHGLKRAILPKEKSKILTSEFYDCSLLKEVVIRGDVTAINTDAFRSCYSLEKVNIPDTVTTIGTYSFYGCYCLEKINFPKSLISIGNSAFGHCRSLKKIWIPENVTTIEKQAFIGCYAVSEYYLYPTTPPTLGGTNAFYCSDDCKIYVPKGCLEAYQTADVWSELADYMVEMEE